MCFITYYEAFHRISKVGKDLISWTPPGTLTPPHLPGQPVPVPDYSFADVFSYTLPESPLVQTETILSHPITSYQELLEELVSL